MGIVFRSISAISSSVNCLFVFRSAFLTFCATINFFAGRNKSIARNMDDIQYQTNMPVGNVRTSFKKAVLQCHPELVSGSLLFVICFTKEIPKQVRDDTVDTFTNYRTALK
jgi:hypothetical protein